MEYCRLHPLCSLILANSATRRARSTIGRSVRCTAYLTSAHARESTVFVGGAVEFSFIGALVAAWALCVVAIESCKVQGSKCPLFTFTSQERDGRKNGLGQGT